MDAEANATILWPPDVKSQLIGKHPEAGKNRRQEAKGPTEDERWLDNITDSVDMSLSKLQEMESIACSSPWDCKESDMS